MKGDMCSLLTSVFVHWNVAGNENFTITLPVTPCIRRSSRCECVSFWHWHNVRPLCRRDNVGDELRSRFPMCRCGWCRPFYVGHFLRGNRECKRIELSRPLLDKHGRHRNGFLCKDHLKI